MGSTVHVYHRNTPHTPSPIQLAWANTIGTRKQHYLIIENKNKKYFIQNNIDSVVTKVCLEYATKVVAEKMRLF